MSQLIVTIDAAPTNPSRLAVCRLIANRLDLAVFNVGEHFRMMAWLVLSKHANLYDTEVIERIASESQVASDEGVVETGRIDGRTYRPPKGFLYLPLIDEMVWQLGCYPDVRKAVKDKLHRYSEDEGAVIFGNTVGIDMFPEAIHKFFLEGDSSADASELIVPPEAVVIETEDLSDEDTAEAVVQSVNEIEGADLSPEQKRVARLLERPI